MQCAERVPEQGNLETILPWPLASPLGEVPVRGPGVQNIDIIQVKLLENKDKGRGVWYIGNRSILGQLMFDSSEAV